MTFWPVSWSVTVWVQIGPAQRHVHAQRVADVDRHDGAALAAGVARVVPEGVDVLAGDPPGGIGARLIARRARSAPGEHRLEDPVVDWIVVGAPGLEPRPEEQRPRRWRLGRDDHLRLEAHHLGLRVGLEENGAVAGDPAARRLGAHPGGSAGARPGVAARTAACVSAAPGLTGAAVTGRAPLTAAARSVTAGAAGVTGRAGEGAAATARFARSSGRPGARLAAAAGRLSATAARGVRPAGARRAARGVRPAGAVPPGALRTGRRVARSAASQGQTSPQRDGPSGELGPHQSRSYANRVRRLRFPAEARQEPGIWGELLFDHCLDYGAPNAMTSEKNSRNVVQHLRGGHGPRAAPTNDPVVVGVPSYVRERRCRRRVFPGAAARRWQGPSQKVPFPGSGSRG